MEKLEYTRTLDFAPNTLTDIRKIYDLDTEKRRNEAFELLEEWVKKQTHFRCTNFDKAYLERTLITSKGSIERAKLKLEKLCTFRTVIPGYFQIYDIKKDFKEVLEIFTVIVLPKQTKDNTRVAIIHPNPNKNIEAKHISDFYKYAVIMCEYLMAHDYSNGLSIILDYKDINIMDIVTKLNLFELKQAFTLVMEGYGMKIKGIYMISPSKAIELLISLFKQVLSAKIGSRIFAFQDVTCLFNYFDKNVLPADYGGNERSTLKLQNEWIDELSSDKNIESLKKSYKARTDETKRLIPSDDAANMAGSFRTLCVD